MNVQLIEVLVGLFLVGLSTSVTRNRSEAGFTFVATVDWFKLVFGVVLVALAIWQGVRLF